MTFIWVLPKSNELDDKNGEALKKFREIFDVRTEMASENINSLCRNFCKENSIQYGAFMKLMRSILTGVQVRYLLLRKESFFIQESTFSYIFENPLYHT